MEDHTFVVGQEFSDVKAFRNAIKEAAIAQHFELRIIKSDLIRYFAKCASEGCPWRIRAVKRPNAPTFTIRSLEGTHTCGRNALNGHHQASVDWIVSFIEERLRDNINYKPKDILNDIHKQYGITIPYKQAWRAKERGLATIYGSSEEGYCLLPPYCEQIKNTNPGSFAEVFTADGTKGIIDSIRKFPNSSHALCMRHLSESIGKEFKNSRLVQLLWKAAYATTTHSFKETMAEIEEVSPEAAKWLQQFHPSQWSLVYFEGTRYGHLSSNIEEFNRWILEARELPISQVIERIHSKLKAEFDERRLKSSSWFSVLAPSAEKRMIEAISCSSTYQVLRSDEVEFEVLSADRSDIVNIGSHSCSCRDWQLHGIPCSHAVAALISCRKDVYAFTEKYFTVVSYRETYVEEINPLPEKLEWRKADEASMADDTVVVRPPKSRRPPGRPEKKRICVEELNREKHTVHCSRCNQTGHYKTTCKADMINSIEQF
ncbi:Transposase, MuDR, plant [Senna tora]|uniref:Transposase, MuDR, plant n=1 Tax=Senna tora TaxID=362788 RepID=A0A834SEE5_9FABA|nr:Transposase, MuDR, plant [Senna tora]